MMNQTIRNQISQLLGLKHQIPTPLINLLQKKLIERWKKKQMAKRIRKFQMENYLIPILASVSIWLIAAVSLFRLVPVPDIRDEKKRKKKQCGAWLHVEKASFSPECICSLMTHSIKLGCTHLPFEPTRPSTLVSSSPTDRPRQLSPLRGKDLP